MRKWLDDIRLWLLGSLTVGLAPFVPQPHVWSKLRWVLGGATGMQPIDWLDLLFHGLPWLLLIRAVAVYAHRASRKE